MAEQIQVGIPINLLAYKPQQQTTALCWQINPEISAGLNLLEFEVEVDVVNTFDSINKKVYTKDNVVNFQNGTFFKAFVIDDPLLFETQNYFWRVRVNSETYVSYWSDAQKKEINTFINDLQYNVPTRIQHVGSGDSELVIEKVYTTMYAMDGIVYSEEELIEEIKSLYGQDTSVDLSKLEYDKDIIVPVVVCTPIEWLKSKKQTYIDTNGNTVNYGDYIDNEGNLVINEEDRVPTKNNVVVQTQVVDEREIEITITIRMIHQARYNVLSNGEIQENQITEQELISALENYGITDNVYEYVGPQEFDIKKITWYEDTEIAENLLPDNYVYTKTGNTNIKRIIEMYMRLIGIFKNEVIQVANNYNYKKTQDKDLYDMLGVLLTYTRNTEEPFITYKYELLNLWNAYLHQGTIDAFNIIIAALYGVVPKIEILKDIVETKWVVYEQMQLLSIDGSTPLGLPVNYGDAYYNSTLNKIVINGATNGTWDNLLYQEPNESTTYQLMENNELTSYQYVASSNGFYEGRPDVERYYVREDVIDTIRPNPYLYTNQYLAHNLVITINNDYSIQLDKKIVLEILNNLKPLNVNIILNIDNNIVPYSYGLIGNYGDPMNLWGQKRIIEGE